MRVYNFSAGPSMLPLEVLEQAQKDFVDYCGCGMSVTEMSHRSKFYDEIHTECIALLKELMNVPENYEVLLVQGGASTQFEAIPLNLLPDLNGKADYIVTGNFAKKAYKEAKKFGDIHLAASSEDKTFTYIPKNPDLRDDSVYTYICQNNTIFGTRYTTLPTLKSGILVADVSSNILSEVMDVNKYGVLYAGAQKNVAPAGVTIVIVRKDLIGDGQAICPTMLKWKTQAEAGSLYNTPPCFSIYMAMLNLRHLKKLGGVSEIQKINEYKAGLLYDFIDNSSFYTNNVNKEDRSLMNVPFVTGDKDMDAKFVKEAGENGLLSIKGHKLVGGMRASIYNAMPVEGVKALIEFMKKFELANK
ncbi:MAG: 3-phosphoserine/phosphohydroxythreonine transaminase [Eubacteriales bacterium]|nr:3-phosphoserine/phosphohydroxythreonine transaminase [Eubacteriales bacterium]